MGLMESFDASDTVRAEALMASIMGEFFRPPASITVSEWADCNRMLSGKASSEPGLWRTDRTPYLRQIMDDLSARSSVQEVVVMFAAQLGKSESGNNWLGYIIDNEPGPVMCVQPTTDMAKRFSRQRIAPMLEETPILRRKVRENRSRDDSNTALMKDFAGGVLVISGANSAAGLRSMPVRYLFLDEIDAYPVDVDGEGCPVELAEKRTSTFPRRKVLKVSTPTTKGFSKIEPAYLTTNANKFHVPCPHCFGLQTLDWGSDKPHGLKWDRRPDGSPDLDTVRYVCMHCGSEIQEHHKPGMLAGGQWIPSKEAARGGKATGYQMSALYAPLGWVSWVDIVNKWHEATVSAAQGDVTKLKTFTNTVLAETWEERGERSDEHALQKRAEPYTLGTVPVGGLVLTAGIDVQRNRWHLNVYAWGRGLESWVVDRHVIDGNPAADEDWDQLTAYLQRRYTQAWHGGTLGLSAISIDSSDQTHAVYNWVRRVQHTLPTVRAVKGSSEDHKPILGPSSSQEVNWKGQKWPNGVKLWTVGVDTAKDLLLGQLGIEPPATPGESRPGCVHFSTDLPREFYEQLTAEQRILVKVGGRDAYKWVKRRPRNEDLDCRNYALHAAFGLGLHNRTDAKWAQLEAAVQPSADLFTPAAVGVAAPAPQVTAPTPKPQPPRPQPARNPAVPRRW